MSRRCFTGLTLLLSLGLASCSQEEPPKPYNVEEVPLSQISEDLAAGKTTSAAITQVYIDRINMYDGPLNGVIAIAGTAWTEDTLYGLAYAYEQASKKRVPPTAFKQAVAAPQSGQSK